MGGCRTRVLHPPFGLRRVFFLSLTVSINFWAVLLLLCSFLLPPVPSSFLLTVLSTDLQAGGSTIAYPGPALEVPGLGRLRRVTP